MTDAENKMSEETAYELAEGTDGNQEKLGIAELIYGTLFSPTATFRRISHDPPLFYGFIVFVAVVFLTSVVYTLVPPDISEIPSPLAGVFAQAKPLIGIAGAMFAFIGWFIQGGVLHLFAEILGGKGRAIGVLTVIALSNVPRVLVIPIQVISYFMAGSFIGSFLTVASTLIVFFWEIVLTVIGLREVHQFSTGRAVGALLIPLGLILLIIVILTIIVIGVAANLIPEV